MLAWAWGTVEDSFPVLWSEEVKDWWPASPCWNHPLALAAAQPAYYSSNRRKPVSILPLDNYLPLHALPTSAPGLNTDCRFAYLHQMSGLTIFGVVFFRTSESVEPTGLLLCIWTTGSQYNTQVTPQWLHHHGWVGAVGSGQYSMQVCVGWFWCGHSVGWPDCLLALIRCRGWCTSVTSLDQM